MTDFQAKKILIWLRSPFVVPTDVNWIAHGPMIFPTWQPDQQDTLPPRQQDWQVQSPTIQIMSQEGYSGISEESGSKVRSPNWKYAY